MTATGAMPARRSEAGATPAERELVGRVQRGDAEAFDLLMRRHLPRARVIARRLMADPDDADDLVQEGFLRVLDRIGSFDPSRPFEPWFSRLLVNLGLDLKRKQAVRRTEPHDVDAAPGTARPDQDAERAELARSFQQALARLPDRQRTIVTLFEIDGLSTGEVATMQRESGHGSVAPASGAPHAQGGAQVMERMSQLFREPPRDAELAALLRSAEAEPGDDPALHRRIMAAAAPRLAALAHAAPGVRWWEWISAWTRIAIPAVATAALAAALLLPGVEVDQTSPGGTGDADSTMIAALFSDPAGRGALAAGLIAPADHDWLLTQVLER
jgi:RNA polymerase sigma-70 factor (ECF subfamily)